MNSGDLCRIGDVLEHTGQSPQAVAMDIFGVPCTQFEEVLIPKVAGLSRCVKCDVWYKTLSYDDIFCKDCKQ